MNFISAEWLKIKRTGIRWMVIAFPILLAFFTLLYIWTHKGIVRINLINTWFNIWLSLIMPLFIGVLVGLDIHKEAEIKQFSALFANQISRKKIFLTKYIFLCLCFLVSILLSTGIFWLGTLGLANAIPLRILLMGVAFGVIGTLPVVALQIWISFRWDLGISISVSIFGFLLSTLIGTTNLGEKIWYLIPWTYAYRLSEITNVFVVNSVDKNFRNQVIGLAEQTGVIGIVASLVTSLLFLAGGISWFKRWET
ncbi:lantibiotic immunity ABC transporter MutG family permease subunit [Pediococcus acidilactici]|uniref:lantibiotic immunity ABC transporter MutG family permease subunit n=1 Tax=Pediococcus acidilactici TaxID=1254 RepID=UPI00186AB491|nr:lantibiotic immunity ABC transporter MutG family permease subunit [Pediococcus acidilactici]QOP72729.1 lantibiotic immunity ABC transporter MutG family permease subunit [Pediococcus acidilactici]